VVTTTKECKAELTQLSVEAITTWQQPDRESKPWPFDHRWLGGAMDLWSWGHWFNPKLSRHQVVSTCTGDNLRTGRPSGYITNTKVNSAFRGK